ncbi:hypothetical protein LguiB_010185 [Lonicera macranthoides]
MDENMNDNEGEGHDNEGEGHENEADDEDAGTDIIVSDTEDPQVNVQEEGAANEGVANEGSANEVHMVDDDVNDEWSSMEDSDDLASIDLDEEDGCHNARSCKGQKESTAASGGGSVGSGSGAGGRGRGRGAGCGAGGRGRGAGGGGARGTCRGSGGGAGGRGRGSGAGAGGRGRGSGAGGEGGTCRGRGRGRNSGGVGSGTGSVGGVGRGFTTAAQLQRMARERYQARRSGQGHESQTQCSQQQTQGAPSNSSQTQQ